ncbi:uncharacterized protein EV420DRAFT_1508279 [Desarmillaria tabescens]|uniref:Uncharacterized protein n=1 Tax=Armillaria tabescens TaxID=1929756 RepID=A0AA39NKJ5_ARMTA|nr:uncharacterized protein EV420DRAFT_1508279 [Desarmillaria tabescens]KAK0467362.1 hypothetical protein EV420DRAFT_1508279 [Desarmillaria tabescens]
MPNLEPIISSSSHGIRTREGERRDTHDSDDSMPPLEDVSDSGSESGWSTEDDEDDDLGRDAVPPSGFMFRPVETAVTWSAGIGSGMDLGIDVDDETPDDTEDSVDSTADGGQSSTENGRPPFVTDGRGRVIGASEEEQDNALSRSFFGRFFFSRSS